MVLTGKFLPQRLLSTWATQAGFGPVVDIREVKWTSREDDKRAAGYVAKQMASYVAKGRTDSLAELVAARRRPLRTSRNWGLTLRAAEAELAAEVREAAGGDAAEGPWALVIRLSNGDLLIKGDGDTERIGPLQDRDERSATTEGQPTEGEAGATSADGAASASGAATKARRAMAAPEEGWLAA